MADKFLELFNMSVTAGWLVLAIVVLRLLLKKVPKTFICFLWLLVAVRLIFPISIESVVSLIPSTETITEESLYSDTPVIDSGINVVNDGVNPVINKVLAPEAGDSVNPMQVIICVASYIWVIGMGGMILYAFISYIRLRIKVREAVIDGDKIWLCDRINTPFILGVIWPRIYIPSSVEEKDKEYVIAHERAHLKRKDHWWKPLGFALLTVYWFNPLMWVAYILLCKDIEYACDEKVLNERGVDCKKEYSCALVNCSVSRRSVAVCPLAFGEVSVKERIKLVLGYKQPAFWMIIGALIVCIAFIVVFMTNPRSIRHCGSDMTCTMENYKAVCGEYYMEDDLFGGNGPIVIINEDQSYSIVRGNGEKGNIVGTYEYYDNQILLENNEDYECYAFEVVDANTIKFLPEQGNSIRVYYGNGVTELNESIFVRGEKHNSESKSLSDETVLYMGEDSRGKRATDIVRDYYEYLEEEYSDKRNQWFTDEYLEMTKNAVYQDMTLLDLEYCTFVSESDIRESDLPWIDEIKGKYNAYCFVQTKARVECLEDGPSGMKGDTINQQYFFAFVLDPEDGRWKIDDFGYPGFEVVDDREEIDYFDIIRENFMFTYYIKDINGNILVEDTTNRQPDIKFISDNVIMLSIQEGTGLTTRWTIYYDIVSGKESKAYYNVLGEYENKTVFIDYIDGRDYLVVCDIFDKAKYYQNTEIKNIEGEVVMSDSYEYFLSDNGEFTFTYTKEGELEETKITIDLAEDKSDFMYSYNEIAERDGYKLAYIVDISEGDETRINVNFVNWVADKDMPNGFRISDAVEENYEYKVNENTEYRILHYLMDYYEGTYEEDSSSYLVDEYNFIKYQKEYGFGLFWIKAENDLISEITEQYVP